MHALPAYNPILITAIELLLSSGIQLRIFHIPRNDNKVANALSQLDSVTAHRLQPGLVITRFSPPHFMLGDGRL